MNALKETHADRARFPQECHLSRMALFYNLRLDASLEFRAWEEQGGELQVGEGVAGGGALN